MIFPGWWSGAGQRRAEATLADTRKYAETQDPMMMAVRLALIAGTAHGALAWGMGVCRVVGAAPSTVHETDELLGIVVRTPLASHPMGY